MGMVVIGLLPHPDLQSSGKHVKQLKLTKWHLHKGLMKTILASLQWDFERIIIIDETKNTATDKVTKYLRLDMFSPV